MGKFADIFNADDYDRGMKEGHADGFAGKGRDFSRMGKTAKFILGGSTTLDSYTRGYKAGYFVGAAERLRAQKQQEQQAAAPAPASSQTTNNTVNINHLTVHIMSSRVIDGQIDLLEQMKSFLQSFTEQFDDAIRTQTSFLENLDSEGLDSGIIDTLDEYLKDKTARLQDLISYIDQEEIPYVEKVITYLEDTPV